MKDHCLPDPIFYSRSKYNLVQYYKDQKCDGNCREHQLSVGSGPWVAQI